MFDRPAVTLLVNVNRSRSRGEVKLRSSDPEAPPIIQPNLLADRYDLDLLVKGAKFARSVLGTKAFAPYFEREISPGRDVQTDAEWADFIRDNAVGSFHPCGTTRMGADSDAVVDPRLRVKGVDGLRVVDSSIIPQVPSGNINAISLVIGEKGAQMILEDRRSR
jgi:choline dehydrogenase